MSKVWDWSRRFLEIANKQPIWWWIILAILLVIPFSIGRIVEGNQLIVFKQLAILFILDSVLFFLVGKTHAKMGVLTLIFLATMELFVTIFYLIAWFSIGTS